LCQEPAGGAYPADHRRPESREPRAESMMTSGNAQIQFLAQLHDESIPVSVYLKSGIRLQGQIESFDEFVISLRSAAVLVVYKNAISTIVPARNFAIAKLDADNPTADLLQAKAGDPAKAGDSHPHFDQAGPQLPLTHSSPPRGDRKSPSMLRRINQ
jgi:host factor-I protein